ncbi:hypothetical protein HPP92_026121 [Vanilla planifolia]|uniref:Retroviral polymerase SH3-like domain-containing protein n=1 Tax=Vanilla planifolia TaxID=51239 RepID=A0A835PFD9_VANPL|nr:hypothetical protein HPP92_026121 [Vanilla planifolia]
MNNALLLDGHHVFESRYVDGVKGYNMWDPITHKIIIRRDVLVDDLLSLLDNSIGHSTLCCTKINYKVEDMVLVGLNSVSKNKAKKHVKTNKNEHDHQRIKEQKKD